MAQGGTENIPRVARAKITTLKLIFNLVNDFVFCPLIHTFKMYLTIMSGKRNT
jgi:hypothetical protein